MRRSFGFSAFLFLYFELVPCWKDKFHVLGDFVYAGCVSCRLQRCNENLASGKTCADIYIYILVNMDATAK